MRTLVILALALLGAAIALGRRPAQQAGDLPPSNTTAADRLASSPRHGEWVTVKAGDSDSVVAWVVYPERREPAPVVVVIHENTGLTTWARGVADQLAAEGFIAIAPELLTMRRTGNLTSQWTPDSGRAAIGTLTNEEVQRWLNAVAQYGMSLPAATKRYAVVGYCWGGARSFLHAVHSPTLAAAVVYYGSPPPMDQLGTISAPVLGLYGGNDARINATIPATDSAMQALGKPYEHHIYEGAGHGFLRAQEGQEGANLRATQAAWPRTIAFLRQHLR